MTITAHTPGPWHSERDDAAHVFHIKDDDRTVADVEMWDGDNDQEVMNEAEANARLIVAAPDMLDALQEAEYALSTATDQYAADKGHRSTILDERLVIARAAIAKAKGGNQ